MDEYRVIQRIVSLFAMTITIANGRCEKVVKLKICMKICSECHCDCNVQWNENNDHIFCGTQPEEADLLQEQVEDFLKAANIVYSFPALFHH